MLAGGRAANKVNSKDGEGEGGEVETFLRLCALGVGPKKAIVNNAGLATGRNGKKEEAGE